MGDEEERAGELLVEVALEPLDGGDVEMVGRLVEDRQVGLLREDPGQGDAAALAAAELVDDRVGVGHAEAIEQRLGLVDALPAAEALDLVAGVGLLREQPVLRRALAAVERGGGGEVATAGLGPGAESVEHDLARAHAGGEARLLLEVGDVGPAAMDDLALVGGVEAGEDPHEGALSGAVHADEADVFTSVDGDADVLEDAADPEAAVDVLGGDDRQGAGWYARTSVRCARAGPPLGGAGGGRTDRMDRAQAGGGGRKTALRAAWRARTHARRSRAPSTAPPITDNSRGWP